MNLFANASLWSDNSSGQSPPITWAAGDSRYEILVTPPEGQSETLAFWINLNQPAGPEDTIEFNYEVGEFNPNGSQQVYIKIISQTDGVIHQEEIYSLASGHVNVELVEGQNYSINITTSGGMYFHSFYGFAALLVPVMPAPIGCLPWWLCVRPDPPEPCPVRVNPVEEFVGFNDYDANFKFPLASSRKPMKIERPADCIVCAPTLLNQTDPVDPVCTAMTVRINQESYRLMLSDPGSITSAPSWFEWGLTPIFLLSFSTNHDNAFSLVWDGTYYGSNEEFPLPQGPTATASMAQPATNNWSCVELTVDDTPDEQCISFQIISNSISIIYPYQFNILPGWFNTVNNISMDFNDGNPPRWYSWSAVNDRFELFEGQATLTLTEGTGTLTQNIDFVNYTVCVDFYTPP